ncbi:hypothetical protein C3Y87_16100 [Carbonactinospora thermoautotrophica]|uniref:helix-turn-helix transcriptional regulator n=1 Tax=Carbonactinospora thermoautotrophica TaxID=1469144 RepID=UPI0022721750|nr:LuxR family transcriptional regulator [Carbonactinospora thermoautotrophica]MCX9192908.1 hypothetical protein [Carbonactinospora thermoautotrophica]
MDSSRVERYAVNSSPLVGRDDALAVLRSAVTAASHGPGECVVVEGPAGIGKSRLLAATADHAREIGVLVAAGRATELDRVAPLSTLLAAVHSSQPPVVDDASLAELGRYENNRFWLIDRLGELIEVYSRSRPLLIALDDAQWADELTVLALRILVPALRCSPVCWVLARRPLPARSPVQDTVDRLAKEGVARKLSLGPLSAEAVAELCANLLGAPPGSSVLTLAARSGGNPFLLEEALVALRDNGRVRIADGVATVTKGELPADFVTAVDQRLRDLSVDGRRLLEAGAVLGRPFTVHEAAGVLGRSAVDLVDAAKEAVEAGTLVDTGSQLAFRHDLIREAVYNGLSRPVRQVLHREAAAVLQAEGASAAETAEHLVRGARKGDAQAIKVFQDAVREVAPNAPGTAADLTTRLLDLLDEHDPSRPRLVADAVRLLASAGRTVEAQELGESALRQDLDAPAEAAILHGLAEALKHAGQDTAVVEYTQRALARPEVPKPARAQLLAIQSHALLHSEDFDDAEAAAVAATELGRQVGEHSATVFGLVARSAIVCSRGDLETAIDLARDAVRLADGEAGEARHRHPRLWLGRALVAADRFTEADAVYELGRREADELGTAWSHPLWHCFLAELRLAAGQLDEAEAEAEAGVQVAEQLTASALLPSLLTTLSEVAVRRGELPTARRYLEQAQRLAAEGVGIGPKLLAWKLALYQEADGRPQKAFETLADLYDALPRQASLLTLAPWAGPHLVRIALRADAPERAEAVLEAARGLAERNPAVASLVGASAHAEGLFSRDLGILRAAVQAYRASPRPLDRASALEDTALAEDAAGHRQEAVALLEEALTHYLNSGAQRDAARVQRRLRRLGVRRKIQGSRHARSGWSSLTESELRVVRLVADGLTNREVAQRLFLSPHTVSSHLRHAFTKLGVSSRVELTRLVLTHETADQ